MSGVLHGIVAALKTAAAATDSFFKYVTLLLHGDGTNGAQNNTFLDGSSNNFTITRNGNTTQGSFSPFSQTGWSNYFDGTGDYLTTPTNAAFTLGTSDFTIECWVNVAGSSFRPILTYRNSTGITLEPDLYVFDTGVAVWYVSGAARITGTTNLTNYGWAHIAVVRSSSNTKLYVNGVQEGSTYSDTNNYAAAATTLKIGSLPVASPQNYVGYISNLRIVVGTAVYTAAFTPPTSPLTNITNTSLLTCQSNRFRDASTNNFTITRNGDVRVEAFSPFNPSTTYSTANVGGSGYFDGTGDYLSVASNAAFGFGSGNWTVEFWLRPSSVTGTQLIVDFRTAEPQLVPHIYLDGTSLVLNVNGAARITATSAVTINVWQHVACVKNGSSTNLYVNGVVVGSTYTDTNTYLSAAPVTIATYFGANLVFYTGYISNLRIVKGTAVYTSAFTPPTAPLTAITNTSLLCNFTNGGVFDNASQTVLETVGNAQVSTTEKKFGTGSMYFDGTGDWLTAIDRPPLRFGTGAFTIEFWIYLESSSISQGVIAKGTSTTGWLVWIDANDRVALTYTTSTLTSTGSLSTLTWHHIAVVREGTGSNQTKIYIDGTNDGTGTVSTDFNQTSVMYIGANRIGGDVFSGYIDDLRITNGYARYTANFTPPSAAFPDN